MKKLNPFLFCVEDHELEDDDGEPVHGDPAEHDENDDEEDDDDGISFFLDFDFSQ
jgi:hypothetical protein